jgi:hypothetical protein
MALFRVVASWFLNPFIENRKAQAWAVGYAEGYIQGRAEAQAEWRAWKLRLIAAEAQGVPFDEPSPGECHYWRAYYAA